MLNIPKTNAGKDRTTFLDVSKGLALSGILFRNT